MSDGPVIVRIHRGVGNQLFQFAAAFSLARRLDSPVRCDNPSGGELLRACIGSRWEAPTTRELWRCGVVRHGLVLPLLSRGRRLVHQAWERLLGLPPRRFAPRNARDHYDDTFDRLRPPCYLYGYFQDQRYWADAVEPLTAIVAEELGLEPTDPEARATDPVIGVHLRRGDYLRYGWELAPDYYERALKAVTAEVGDQVAIRVVGDDPTSVAAFAAQLERDGHVVELDSGEPRHVDPSLADLIRLAECEHLVLSNSSFAWWGGALGDHLHPDPGRVVLMPDTWLGDEPSAHLRQPRWRAVSAGTGHQGVFRGREQ